MKVLEQLGRISKTSLVTVALLLVATQGMINYFAGPDFSFALFYLLPVTFTAWLVGRGAGYAISLACATGYFLTAFLSTQFDGRERLGFFNALARLAAFLFVAHFVDAFRRSLEHEKELARTDELTGATNRRSFFETAQSEINRARRHHHPFTVAYLDIDDFKALNDRFGHASGDAVLREVTREIKANVREIDMVARLGGDEFVVLLPETGEAAGRLAVSRLRANVCALAARKNWRVTFSIGVVTWTSPPRTVDTMIRQADDTMYAVKKSGKNRVAHLTISGEPAAEPVRAA
ncbi:MAG: GGDEF domain-containing protein [Pyrinomonadaceae bacterium]